MRSRGAHCTWRQQRPARLWGRGCILWRSLLTWRPCSRLGRSRLWPSRSCGGRALIRGRLRRRSRGRSCFPLLPLLGRRHRHHSRIGLVKATFVAKAGIRWKFNIAPGTAIHEYYLFSQAFCNEHPRALDSLSFDHLDVLVIEQSYSCILRSNRQPFSTFILANG